MKFVNYNLKDYINQGLKSIDFYETTSVQEIIIPKILNKQSVVVKSATGTGKTHAFIIPILQNLDEDKKEVQAVIISPTRELAFQLMEEFTKITKFNENIDIRMYVGGTNRDAEIDRLSKSQPQIVIGTIGKINDLVNNANALKIYTASTVIIDEADMVFGSKEGDEIDNVFKRFEYLKQVCAFSATIPNGLTNFINKYLLFSKRNKCELYDLSNKLITKDEIEYIFIPTKNQDKLELLVNVLHTFTPYLVLIFANTKNKVDEIASYLSENNIKCIKITGDLESRERKQVLKRIKDGEVQYVVASDIASRGIDIQGASHVINFELPKEIEFFIHRVGRVGRNNLKGQAISFYDFDDDNYLTELRKKHLTCTYMALKDGILQPTKKRNGIRKSTKIQKIEEEVHMRTPMPKKVKPGYKKKRLEKINKKLHKMKHQKIDEMYFKNIHRQKAKEKEKLNGDNYDD